MRLLLQEPMTTPLPEDMDGRASILMHLSRLRTGGEVQRYHADRTRVKQLVSSHSWGVLLIILRLNPSPSLALINAAVLHDIHEAHTGDVRAPAKWANITLKAALAAEGERFDEANGIAITLNDEEQAWLKGADYLEGLFFCLEEMTFGNNYAAPIFANFAQALTKLTLPPPLRFLFGSLVLAYQNAIGAPREPEPANADAETA